MVELMVAVLIMSVIFSGGYLIFATGQAAWFMTDVNIQLQENMRQTLEKIIMELRQTQPSQQQIYQAAGPASSDIIIFSVPVICEAGGSLIDVNGDVAHWGAPLTWGCTASTCMDADNDCSTVDYKYIEYRIDNNHRILRRVLDETANLVRQDVLANNIIDFQAQINGNIMTLDVSIQQTSMANRVLTQQMSVDITLRN